MYRISLLLSVKIKEVIDYIQIRELFYTHAFAFDSRHVVLMKKTFFHQDSSTWWGALISSDPQFVGRHVLFTTVHFKPMSDPKTEGVIRIFLTEN